MNSMKRQKDRTMKDELFRLVGAQYATGDQWRYNSRKNEEREPKQNRFWDVTVDRSKIVDGTGDRVKSDAVKSNIA